MSYGSDPYSAPDKHGLTLIGTVEWSDEAYEFDLTAVWRDGAGGFLWADDSGCSCPSPFEDIQTVDELTRGDFHEMAAHLVERAQSARAVDAQADMVELLGRAVETAS